MTLQFVLITIFLIFFVIIGSCVQPSSFEKIPLNNKQLANELSIHIKKIGPIDESFFDDYSKFKEYVNKINQLTWIINEKIGVEIPEIGSALSDFEKIKEFKLVLKYIPLLDPYNKLYESSLNLPSDQDKDYETFYANLGEFSFEVCILESQISYKFAYKATGDIAYNFKLYKLVPYIGNEGYSILLSEIHWSIREKFEKQTKSLSKIFFNIT